MEKELLQNEAAAIQGLLYENPLYHWIAEGERNLNVMVIGFDRYAARFIDLCLMAGQMKGHALYLTVVVKDPEAAQAEYLKSRPALASFVNVGGSLSGSGKEAYAVLDFMDVPGEGHAFCTAELNENRRTVEEILLTSLGEERVHYIFLSMGGDAYNRSLAQIFCKTAELLENRCSVNYIQERALAEEERNMLCNPVAVGGAYEPADSDELERMAFCTHLLWTGMENTDMQKAWEEFCQPYYHESSISYALSIGYKLNGFGITGRDADELASNFYRTVLAHRDTDEACRQAFAELTALEHRRWVLEKLTDGWQAPPLTDGKTDFSYCIEIGSIKDSKRKYHPCIVRSTAASPLKNEEYRVNRHKKWDDPHDPADELDELDRFSVSLHRFFRRYTEQFYASHPMETGEAAQIGRLLQGAGDYVLKEYRRFCLCLRNILEGEAGYAKQYDACEKRFAAAVADTDSLGREKKQTVRKLVDGIRRSFFPVIECCLYRDYKALDEALLDNLAFILTYRRACHLAAPLNLAQDRNGESDTVFRNVASGTVIHPDELTYLYCADRFSDYGLLRRKLLSIASYFEHRRIRCRIHLQILFLQNSAQRLKALRTMLHKLQQKMELDGSIAECADEEQAVKQAVLALEQKQVDLFDGTNALFASNRRNSQFILEVTDKFPYFEFDSTRKQFLHDSGCDYLHYIADRSYMRVEDMFAMMHAEDRAFHYPDFAEEYEALWGIYTGDAIRLSFERAVGCWNELCGQLEQYHETNGRSAVKGLLLKTGKYRMEEFARLLEGLGKKRFIEGLSVEQNRISFRYQSDKIKALLTKAGELLEVYTYFEACKTGYFDDVVSGYEFKWETGGVQNELDCVLTKGFCSMIVECKARSVLSQDFYYKLDSLAGRFGIGTKKVLIANTYRKGAYFEDKNEQQRTRGSQMDIITVSGEAAIRNIGQTLQKIMEDMI